MSNELEGVKWDAAGNPYAELENYEGGKTLMKEWLTNDPTGQDFAERFNTPASIEKITEVLELHSMKVSSANLSWVFERLKDSGQLTSPAIPTVSLTRAGTPMTQAQQTWSEYRTFSETHSMDEVRNRMRVDAGYRNFVSKNNERSWEHAGDGATLTDGVMKPSSVRGRL